MLLAALLALLATGCNLRAMGANFDGQLGDGTTTASSTAVTVSGPTFAQVSTGSLHTCGIAEAGTLHCWGSGVRDRLGLGSPVARVAEPTQVGNATDWVSVSAGESHSCGIRGVQRQVFCWGDNGAGKAVPSGAEASPPAPVPTLVDPRGGFTTVSAGRQHSCAITSTGQMFCWGLNSDGRLGVGDTANPDVLRQVPGTWRSVSADDHTCGIQTDATLHCWGPNDHGQLGIGDRVAQVVPRPIPHPGGWAEVDLGSDHTCARSTAGRLLCWGDPAEGRLGVQLSTDRLVPIAVQPDQRWTALGVGAAHGCAVRTDHAVFCWGRNDRGQLGDGTTTNRSSPRQVRALPQQGALAVAAGLHHTHVILRPEE